MKPLQPAESPDERERTTRGAATAARLQRNRNRPAAEVAARLLERERNASARYPVLSLPDALERYADDTAAYNS